MALSPSTSPTSALCVVGSKSNRRARVAVACLSDCREGEESLRRVEDAERMNMCEKWADVAVQLLDASDMDISRTDVSRVHLIRMFTNRAASTLKKRLRGWRTWWDFCRTSSWNVASPTLPQLLDFFESLAVGVHEDRGRNRKAKAMGVVAAMKFTASRLQLGVLLGSLRSPLLEPWGCPDKWRKRRVRDATPLAFKV